MCQNRTVCVLLAAHGWNIRQEGWLFGWPALVRRLREGVSGTGERIGRSPQVHAVGSWRPRLWPVRGVVRGFVGGAFGGSGDGLLGPCLPDVLLVGVGLVVR